MHCWRITKYDPQYRDENGFYMKDDWTSINDVGKDSNGAVLTFDAYLRYENAYVDAIIQIMKANSIESLQVEELEKNSCVRYDDLPDLELKHCYNSLRENLLLSTQDIPLVSRLALRSIIWCKLYGKQMFVHFGYDYYMYIGSNNKAESVISAIENTGLFIEEMPSPYNIQQCTTATKES